MCVYTLNGGVNEVRTRDLLNAIQTRYQLRHNPIAYNAANLQRACIHIHRQAICRLK